MEADYNQRRVEELKVLPVVNHTGIVIWFDGGDGVSPKKICWRDLLATIEFGEVASTGFMCPISGSELTR